MALSSDVKRASREMSINRRSKIPNAIDEFEL